MFKLSRSSQINFLKINKEAWQEFYLPRKKRQARIATAWRAILYFFYIMVFSLVLGILIYLVNLDLIYKQARVGGDLLRSAIQDQESGQINEALIATLKSQTKFNAGQEILKEWQNGLLATCCKFFDDELDKFQKLLGQSLLLAQANQEYLQFKQDKVKLFNLNERKKILSNFYNKQKDLKKIAEEISFFKQRAYAPSIIPLYYTDFFPAEYTGTLVNFLEKSSKEATFITKILGYPQKAYYLLVFEDSAHLRPSGGQIKVIGLLEMENGQVVKLSLENAQVFDDYARGHFDKSMLFLKNYASSSVWNLNNANWSPDWPQAAKRIEWVFSEEKKYLPTVKQDNFSGRVDAIVAITDNFLVRILEAIGPLDSDSGNLGLRMQQVLDSSTASTSLKYFLLGLNKRMGKLSLGEKKRLGGVLRESIVQKEILVYFKDAQMQSMVENYGLSGEFNFNIVNYLSIIDYNLSGNDDLISRKINYKLKQQKDNWLVDLTINYFNESKDNSNYVSYLRIYLPANIRLTTSTEEMEIRNKTNRTIFNVLVKVKSGQITPLHFKYILPSNINPLYLYIQKQPGLARTNLDIDFYTKNKIKSYNPTGFNTYYLDDKHIHWEDELVVDKIFKAEN